MDRRMVRRARRLWAGFRTKMATPASMIAPIAAVPGRGTAKGDIAMNTIVAVTVGSLRRGRK